MIYSVILAVCTVMLSYTSLAMYSHHRVRLARTKGCNALYTNRGEGFYSLLASGKNISIARRQNLLSQDAVGTSEDAEFKDELERELRRSQLRAPVTHESMHGVGDSLNEIEVQLHDDNSLHPEVASKDSVEDAAALILMLETMREHSAALSSRPPKSSHSTSSDLNLALKGSVDLSDDLGDEKYHSSLSSRKAKSSKTDRSYLALLNGKKTRDIHKIRDALKRLLNDQEALQTPSILAKCMASLDSCKAHPNELLSWWDKLTSTSSVQVTAKALKSLLAQIMNRKKGDRSSVRRAIGLIMDMPRPPHDLWSTVSVNLAVQLMIDAKAKDDLDNFISAVIENTSQSSHSGAPTLLSLRSLVPLLSAYGIIWNNLDRAKAIYSLKEHILNSNSSREKELHKGETIVDNQYLAVLTHHKQHSEIMKMYRAMKGNGSADSFTFTTILRYLADTPSLDKSRAHLAPNTASMLSLWDQDSSHFFSSSTLGQGIEGTDTVETVAFKDVAYSILVKALMSSKHIADEEKAMKLLSEWPRPCVAHAAAYGLGLSMQRVNVLGEGMQGMKAKVSAHIDKVCEVSNLLHNKYLVEQSQKQQQQQTPALSLASVTRQLLSFLLEGYLDAGAYEEVIAAYFLGTVPCHEMDATIRESNQADTIGCDESENIIQAQLLVRSSLSTPHIDSQEDTNRPETVKRVSDFREGDNQHMRIIYEDLLQDKRAFNAVLAATASLIRIERRRALTAIATNSEMNPESSAEEACTEDLRKNTFADYFDKTHRRSFKVLAPDGQDTRAVFLSRNIPCFSSVHSLWAFVKELYKSRQNQSKCPEDSLVDSVTISSLFECVARHGSGIGTDDFRFVKDIFKACVNEDSFRKTSSRDADKDISDSGIYHPVLNSWGLHAYLRCHTVYAHSSSLQSLLTSLPTVAIASREKARYIRRKLQQTTNSDHSTYRNDAETGLSPLSATRSFTYQVGHMESFQINDPRTTDEIINALIRVQGLHAAIDYLQRDENTRRKMPQDEPKLGLSALRRLSRASLGNCIIYFDRQWRDIDSESTKRPLLISDVSSILSGETSNSEPDATVDTSERKKYVSSRSVHKREETSRDITKELAMIIAGLLVASEDTAKNRRFGREWLLSRWAGIGAVLISRGDIQQAVTMFRLLLQQTGTYTAAIGNYTSSEVARAIELAIYSALDGSVPLLSNDLQATPRGDRSPSLEPLHSGDTYGMASSQVIHASESSERANIGKLNEDLSELAGSLPPPYLASELTNRRISTLSLLEQPEVDVSFKSAGIPVNFDDNAEENSGKGSGKSRSSLEETPDERSMELLMESDSSFAFISEPGAHSGSLSSRLMQIANNNRKNYGDKRITCNLMDVLSFLEEASSMDTSSVDTSSMDTAKEADGEADGVAVELDMLPISLPLLEAVFEDALTNRMLAQASRAVKLLQSGWVIDITGSTELGVVPSPHTASMATRQVELAKKWTALVLAANLSGAAKTAKRQIRGSISKATKGASRKIGGAMRGAVLKAEDSYQQRSDGESDAE